MRSHWLLFSTIPLLLASAADAVQARVNRLISILETGAPAIGIYAGATGAPRIAKVLATSDLDFIVADVEHEVYDFPTLRSFFLGIEDFSRRYRTEPREAPTVLVKLAHRAGWDPRYEIAETLKVGPAMGVWIPFVESGKDLELAISAVRRAETSGLGGINIPREKREPWPLDPAGELFVVAMIESARGVENAGEIIATPGLGAIEPVHLSEEDTARIVELCMEKGVFLATEAAPEDVAARVEQGFRLIHLGWDFNLLRQELDGRISRTREILKKR
ncbi:MAG: aldolase/citrate lyase family protein [Vicinamibacteria bacterium]